MKISDALEIRLYSVYLFILLLIYLFISAWVSQIALLALVLLTLIRIRPAEWHSCKLSRLRINKYADRIPGTLFTDAPSGCETDGKLGLAFIIAQY